jgi:hypothetical protein
MIMNKNCRENIQMKENDKGIQYDNHETEDSEIKAIGL